MAAETIEMAYDVYETSETRLDKCPIIFLHGLFWNKHMFKDLSDALCHATKRKVFCADLRCHDESPFHPECSVNLMAEDIKRFIRDRKLEKVSFVCHSASCTAAYLVTIDEPEIVEKLVFIDHPPFPECSGELYKKNMLSQFVTQNRFLDTLDPSISLPAAKRKILDLKKGASTEGQKIFLEKVAYELIKVNNQFTWKTNHKFLTKGYIRNFIIPPRGRSEHDILIIRCENSTRVTDESFARILRYNPNSKLMTIKDSTHLLMFEKQEEFLQAVKDFLS